MEKFHALYSNSFSPLRFARGCASCAVRAVLKLSGSTMSQATLFLILLFTLLQPLESFLAATPRASVDRLDMRSGVGRRWNCPAGNTRLEVCFGHCSTRSMFFISLYRVHHQRTQRKPLDNFSVIFEWPCVVRYVVQRVVIQQQYCFIFV